MRSYGIWLFAAAFFLASCGLVPQHRREQRAAFAHEPPAKLAACVRNSACRSEYIVDHRGFGFEALGAPENSRMAAKLAVDFAGVQFLETDLRMKNGIIFVMHDPRLDRTTNLKGAWSGASLATVRSARLADGETIPTLGELYAITRGKAILVLDMKDFAIADVAALGAWIEKNGSFDDFVLYADSIREFLGTAALKRRHPEAIVMAQVYNMDDIREVKRIYHGYPDIVQTGLVPSKGETDWLHGQGTKVYANAHVFEYGMLFDFTRNSLPALFGNLGADFVETDYPRFWLGRVMNIS